MYGGCVTFCYPAPYSTVTLLTYSQSLVSERPARAQSLQAQLMFATSTDVVVYYLIRKSSLIAFEWYHFYVIEVTISRDISKIKKMHYCLLVGTYLRVWLICISFESPSKMLSNGTSFNSIDPLLTEL